MKSNTHHGDDSNVQDGLLAARILVSLFRQDDVPYRLVPVGGYSELEARRDEALASEEVCRGNQVAQLMIVTYADSAFSGLASSSFILLHPSAELSPPHYRLTSTLEFAKSFRSRLCRR